jgi:hypothetical protein
LFELLHENRLVDVEWTIIPVVEENVDSVYVDHFMCVRKLGFTRNATFRIDDGIVDGSQFISTAHEFITMHQSVADVWRDEKRFRTNDTCSSRF